MAWIDQDRKSKISAVVKPILKKYGIKGTLAIRNHSTLVLTIKSGKIDFIQNWNDVCSNIPRAWEFEPAKNNVDVNVYHYTKHFSGNALAAITELVSAMNEGNHDNSDIQSDYFDVGWYVDIKIGRFNKPYTLE